jgi:hypothetical protein
MGIIEIKYVLEVVFVKQKDYICNEKQTGKAGKRA